MTKEEKENYERLILTAPDMLEALHEALKVMQLAKKYFPKSIKNPDTFTLLNVEENSILKAIRKAESLSLAGYVLAEGKEATQ